MGGTRVVAEAGSGQQAAEARLAVGPGHPCGAWLRHDAGMTQVKRRENAVIELVATIGACDGPTEEQ
jgi:hypothetical protein